MEYSSHISHIDSSLWFSVLFFFFLHYSYNFQQLIFFLGIFYSFQFSQCLVTNILLNSQPLCDFHFLFFGFSFIWVIWGSDLCERLKIFSGFDWKRSLESGVHTTSVLPMPDNRQVQKNAMPNQSANNIEGRTEFSCTLWGVRRSDYSFVLRNMFYGFWCLVLIMVVLF